jgi:DNA polymerase-1
LEYRTLSKLQSTYVEGLKAMVNPRSKRVHTSFNQSIAATGRLSSTDPNLQNIPIRGEEGRKIREAFVAPPGHFLLSADYSQIELRLLAAFSQDPHLVEAYQEGLDVHAQTAAHIFGLKLTDVAGEQRAIGKTVNFGVIYGQSPFGLAQQLDVPQSEAKQFIESFYQKYATVRDYKEKILAQARRVGYVSSYLGRRRYLPDLNSRNKPAQQNAERAAFNTVFQGSAADLIKKAMILIDKELTHQKMTTKMLLQVHDELVFEVPKDEVEGAQKMISHVMESAFELLIPLKVSCKIGKNWADAH